MVWKLSLEYRWTHLVRLVLRTTDFYLCWKSNQRGRSPLRQKGEHGFVVVLVEDIDLSCRGPRSQMKTEGEARTPGEYGRGPAKVLYRLPVLIGRDSRDSVRSGGYHIRLSGLEGHQGGSVEDLREAWKVDGDWKL